MKKKVDYIEQMKNSQQFLSKLNGFKKAAKDIKEKNKLVSHRNIWVKEYKYLSRLFRDSEQDLRNYFEGFDQYFGFQIQQRQIFRGQDINSYSQILRHNEEQLAVYESQVWGQLRSLPLLLDKTKEELSSASKPKSKESSINVQDVKQIVTDIGAYLSSVQSNNSSLQQQIQNQFLSISRLLNQTEEEEGNDGEFSNDIFKALIFGNRSSSDNVQGFDFQKIDLKRIEQSEAYLREYLESLSDRLSEDQILSVIEEYQHTTSLLNQTFELEIEKINLEYEQVLSLDEQMLSMSENYQKINHIYSTYLNRGKSIPLYNERLGIQFPKISRKVLDRVTEYIEGRIYKGRKYNAVKRNYLREKQQLLYKLEREVNERIENKIKKAQKQAEILQKKQERLKLETELEKLRSDYKKRKLEKQNTEREEENRKIEEERKKEQIRRLYLEELKEKAVEIHEEKEKRRKEQEQVKEKERLLKQAEKKKQLSLNKPKVSMRQAKEIKKIEKKVEESKQKKEFQEKNEERINKAIQKYSFRPEVQASQQRLIAPTEAQIKRKEVLYDKADKIELSKMTGYNIKQLMGDMRYKLNTALFEAGLANTDYARQVLNGMSKRPQS